MSCRRNHNLCPMEKKLRIFFNEEKKGYNDSKTGGEKLVVTDTSPYRLPTWHQFMAGEENMNERGKSKI